MVRRVVGGRVRTRTRVSTSPADPKLARDAPGVSGVLEVWWGCWRVGDKELGRPRGRTTTPELPDTRIARVAQGDDCGSCVDTLCVSVWCWCHTEFLRSLVSASGVLLRPGGSI